MPLGAPEIVYSHAQDVSGTSIVWSSLTAEIKLLPELLDRYVNPLEPVQTTPSEE